MVATAAPQRSRRHHPLHALLTAALLAAIFLGVIPRIAAYEDVWRHVDGMATTDISLLAAVTVWNLITYWLQLMAALPGLTLRQAVVSNQASTAVSNVVPGGGAIGSGLTWTMYRKWGFSREASARALLLSSVWNNLFKFGLPLVALSLATLAHGDDDVPFAVGFVSTSLLVVAAWGFVSGLRSPSTARRIGSVLGRAVDAIRRDDKHRASAWTAQGDRIREDAAALVGRRWIALTVTTIISHLSLFLVLLTSLRVVGAAAGDLAWIDVLAAFAVVRVALVIPVTPGGAGIAELGLTGALVAAGAPTTEAVAGVLLFRALTWLLPVGLGGVAYLVWLREVARVPAAAR